MAADQTARTPLTVAYDPELIVWRFIRDLVKSAQESGQDQEMTRHLVGAMLHLAFPTAIKENPTCQQEGQTVPLGDFLLGDTVFQIIMAPVMPVYDQCRDNVEHGFQVFLLVPDKYFCGTRQNAEIILPGKIMVASVESFVCQALERLAGFTKSGMGGAIRQLLETYNERIKNLGSDRAPSITLPQNLAG
jgi:hypothetical protein